MATSPVSRAVDPVAEVINARATAYRNGERRQNAPNSPTLGFTRRCREGDRLGNHREGNHKARQHVLVGLANHCSPGLESLRGHARRAGCRDRKSQRRQHSPGIRAASAHAAPAARRQRQIQFMLMERQMVVQLSQMHPRHRTQQLPDRIQPGQAPPTQIEITRWPQCQIQGFQTASR